MQATTTHTLLIMNLFLLILTLLSAASVTADVNKSYLVPTSACINLGDVKAKAETAAVDDATDASLDSPGIVAEDCVDTGLEVRELKAKAKIQADKEEELRERLAEEIKEKGALESMLAEAARKESWFDTSGISINSIVGFLATASLFAAWGLKKLNSPYNAVAPSATPTQVTNNWNIVVNNHYSLDPPTAGHICDTPSYPVDLVKVKVIDVID